MAQTLASGVVIPAPGDRISAQGVQEIRTLGASVSMGLAQTDLQARARDAELEALIAGMEGMAYVGTWEQGRVYRINDVVTHGGDSWARLTAGSTGVPGIDPAHWGLVARKGDGGGFGQLTETATPGLWEGVDAGIEARLAAMEATQARLSYRSGRRNITSLLSPAAVSGNLYIERRGDTTWLQMDALVLATTADTIYSNVVPNGFQITTPAEIPAAQRSVLDAKGGLRTYGGSLGFYYLGQTPGPFRGMVSWPTNQSIPTTLPGTPA